MTIELHQPLLLNKEKTNQLVKNWMSPPSTITIGQNITQAMENMAFQKCHQIIVVDEQQHVLGLLKGYALFSLCLDADLHHKKIDESMLEAVQPVYTEDSIVTISPIHSQMIPVINSKNKLVGMLTDSTLFESYSYLVNSKASDAEALDVILESAYEGVVLSDEKGIIRKMNKAYKNFLGLKEKDVVGKHVTDVIENTRIHNTIEAGIPERGHIQEMQGQSMVVHRIPIWRNGEVTGCIGMLIFEGVSELYKILERANETNLIKIKRQPVIKKQKLNTKMTFESIIGESNELAACKSIARRAARTMATVMITGESGTGKEMFARAIHHISPYANGPFIGLNCAAIPEHLLEAELFGYEEGAFTGARRGGKPGKFELASEGTLFLDEIGDMPLHMQAKILRVLQEKEIERVGGIGNIPIHVRIIAATNQRLEERVKSGSFREDLYYRLNIIRVIVPSLKERKDDIPILLSHHLNRFCEQYGFKTKTFTRKAIEALVKYDWPGNIREVVNTAEQLVTLVEEDTIELNDLPQNVTGETRTGNYETTESVIPLKAERLEQERETIQRVLREVDGNKTKAAEVLGIHRSTLYQKLKRLQTK
jgi:transcriptional regulator with PAS, ATPase and Fis domain